MRTPNWEKTFTYSIEIHQFRTEKGQQDYRLMIDKLLEEGASFAVSAGYLWLSDFAFSTLQTNFSKGTP